MGKIGEQAIVCNIQRFSLEDGPGIRTTVFFKGCPLRCAWCHNPECISPAPQLEYMEDLCRNCGACVHVCPNQAHSTLEGVHTVDFQRCTGCGACVRACVYEALTMVGKVYTTEQLERELLKDAQFYFQSGGGITFSGGEPLLHCDFLEKLLPNLKKAGIHIAVDTCGHVEETVIRRIAPMADLLLYDIKAADSALHTRLTGRANDRIISNLHVLRELKVPVCIRIPLVQGENDGLEDMERAAEWIAACPNVELVELLNYHKYGVSKYRALGIPYRGEQFEAPDKKHVQSIMDIFKRKGISVTER